MIRNLIPETTPSTLRADALAGLLGAVLALPQGIAFATLAGLPPQYGIYSAIVPCAVAAIFGSSHHVVSGPTNANSLALFAALSPLAVVGGAHYIALAIALTGLVGLVQLAVGVFRLGWITDFIAPSVLLGFMSGAAILIGLYATPDLLGIDLSGRHGVIQIVSGLLAKAQEYNPTAVLVGIATLVATVGTARISRKLPFMLIGIVAGFGVCELAAAYSHLQPVMRIGAIPSVLPPFSVPSVPLSKLPELMSIAGALSIVALGQSISIAKVLAQRSGQRLDADREFIGQGLSNIVGSFFSCYVSCGSLNRSLPNYLAGARTQLAAVFGAGFLLVFASATRPLLERIPMAAIATMLIYIAVGLVDARNFRRLAHLNLADFCVAMATLVGMLLLPFQDAILVGTGLSLLLYLNRTAHPKLRVLLPDPSSPLHAFVPIEGLPALSLECPQLKLVRIEGSIYFGAVGYVSQRLHQLRAEATQKHLLLMSKSMNFIDLAGADVLEHELKVRRSAGGDLYVHRPRPAVLKVWRETGFDVRLGAANVFATKRDAIASIYQHLDGDICASCKVKVFSECREARQDAEEGRAKFDCRAGI